MSIYEPHDWRVIVPLCWRGGGYKENHKKSKKKKKKKKIYINSDRWEPTWGLVSFGQDFKWPPFLSLSVYLLPAHCWSTWDTSISGHPSVGRPSAYFLPHFLNQSEDDSKGGPHRNKVRPGITINSSNLQWCWSFKLTIAACIKNRVSKAPSPELTIARTFCMPFIIQLALIALCRWLSCAKRGNKLTTSNAITHWHLIRRQPGHTSGKNLACSISSWLCSFASYIRGHASGLTHPRLGGRHFKVCLSHE